MRNGTTTTWNDRVASKVLGILQVEMLARFAEAYMFEDAEHSTSNIWSVHRASLLSVE